MKKNFTALILCFLMLSGAVSCGSNDTAVTTETTLSEGTSSAVESTVETTDYLGDVLPDDIDMDGYTFRMFIRNDESYIKEMYIEESDGEILNDAIFERNSKVAEMYNITYSMVSPSNVFGYGAENVILSGEDAYDLLVTHARHGFGYAHNGLVLDYNTDLPYIDTSKEWWNQDAVKEFAFNDKLYVLVGDISYYDFGSAIGMLFNKKLLNDYQLDSPYELVLNDEWTFDKFSEMAASTARDLNGDSMITSTDDQLGYIAGHWGGPNQIIYSAGERICRMEDGVMSLTLNTPRTALAFEKFFSFIVSEGMHVTATDAESYLAVFEDGRALFSDTNQIRLVEQLREMEDDFGIIPWPKLDENVDTYYGIVNAGCSGFTVPITISDPEKTSLIIEALCYIGHTDVIPKYYDVVLTTKYSRDEASIAMLDIIYNGRVFDIGYYYNETYIGPINSIGTIMSDSKNYNFASYYASLEQSTLANIEKINELYE